MPTSQRSAEEGLPGPVATASGPFGAELAPALQKACGGDLTDIHWFRTDWQRGGALTGFATWQTDMPVVVKLPVPPAERAWLAHLSDFGDVAPQLFAHGETLGGYDMAWVVMERLQHGPLGSSWDGAEFDLLIEAAGRFYAAATSSTITGTPNGRDWHAILDHARESVAHHSLANEQRWSKALKLAQRKITDWMTVWDDRPQDQWCHGDLHLANAMTREPAPQGPALLFDYAKCHRGHWVEDAIYFEHLYWSRKQRLGGRKICSLIAKHRKKLGLPVHPDWPKWADVQRALLALGTPAILVQDGDPAHVDAALGVLERSV